MKNIIQFDYRIKTVNNKGKRHSYNDKPAVEWIGGRSWYKEGKLHRENGPASEWNDGEKHWYYEGKEIKCESTEEFLRIINLKTFW